MSTSPYGAARAAAPGGAAGRGLARAPHAFEQFEDTWVTVFGFSQSDLPLVIREFSKAGDIQQVGENRFVCMRVGWQRSCSCRRLPH